MLSQKYKNTCFKFPAKSL